jgi:Tol biopolymer transport system component
VLLAALAYWVLPREEPVPRFSNPIHVTAAIGVEDHPTWSPDGRTLAYQSSQSGNWDIWLTQVGSGQPVNRIGHAVFSPDGKRLAYSRGRRVGNLWKLPILPDRPATWSDARQLTFDEAHIEFVDLAPDRKRLLLSSDRSGSPDLWVLPVEGGEMQQLTTDRTPDWMGAWSPNGAEIGFHAYRSGNRDIWVMPAGGGPARQVTRDEASDCFSAWSPDGREIAFWSSRTGNPDIWVVTASGGEERQITSEPATDAWPSWSPDGKRLVFASDPSGGTRLWWVPPGRGYAEPLTRGRGWFSRWSPEGKRIYYTGGADLWSVSAQGGDERAVTDLSGKRGSLGSIALATDGESVFVTWQDDIGDLWVMDASRAARD